MTSAIRSAVKSAVSVLISITICDSHTTGADAPAEPPAPQTRSTLTTRGQSHSHIIHRHDPRTSSSPHPLRVRPWRRCACAGAHPRLLCRQRTVLAGLHRVGIVPQNALEPFRIVDHPGRARDECSGVMQPLEGLARCARRRLGRPAHAVGWVGRRTWLEGCSTRVPSGQVGLIHAGFVKRHFLRAEMI